ncbi:DUF952 domain-containing protein [Synechococcus sp. CC9616]|uniref:DUF952 domain-containing protein n=1 Tax=Synechococcus sp. CC9616 TaxID=110663 RepID=UPI00048F4FAE|nr:DUF952 domain-containing protein [Synechococcus sp. CC9616]
MLPILYSFRRCPYAMRARWALLQAGLLVHWREIALRAKPQEMLDTSPKGTVPVLVLEDGTVMDESLELMQWALAQANPRHLVQNDANNALIAENDAAFKHHLDRFKYTDRYPGETKESHEQAGRCILRSWSDRIAAHGWLTGPQIGIADSALWPFVRQWRIADPDGFDGDASLAPLKHWLQHFLNSPDFERLMQRADPWCPGGHQPVFPADAIPVPLDQPLFHLAIASDWQAAQANGSYCISTRGMHLEQVGYIHCSWEHQVADTHRRFYTDAGEVLLLEINTADVAAPLRADASPSGELFPHLYGALPLQAVSAANRYVQEAA